MSEEAGVIINHINAMLIDMSEKSLNEISNYVISLRKKEQKHDAFVKRLSEIEANPDYIECNSIDEVMQAIYNIEDDKE
ncbi:MAG: hypothetical protein HQL05_08750 [Nitrospirae bacterium]|uniref:hypothetical protein n=1 Tax=Candidatus Magnetobacterium casense TaxID=1455061 RepID=UPI0012DC1AA6|nr:hypothetical protein [Candidatus Magnetobacterium casensis]MBF0337908.1 hypothetical protein [Nitrospirota bacterium]